MSARVEQGNAFHSTPPPEWSLRTRKRRRQQLWDLLGAPLRMVILPDHQSERLHLTSLRAERFRVVLPELRGRVLDVGCGDNMLLRLYAQRAPEAAAESLGADVTAWNDDVHLIENSANLGLPDASFDTVCFVACLNHIPERVAALKEAQRVLRPGGRVIVTMINRVVGTIGHALWWYSEDKEREMDPGELMGMNPREIESMLVAQGFRVARHRRFGYGLNHLFVSEKALLPADDRVGTS